MGIHDRDYYNPGRRGVGGGGLSGVSFRPRSLSVTSWLIIINVSIFAIDALLPRVDIADIRVVRSDVPAAVVERAVAPADADRPSNVRLGQAWDKPLVDPQTGAQIGIERYRTWHPLNGYGHFSLLKGFRGLEVWRVVTFQFLHADITHLFFNMLGLFIFGGMVEQFLGRKRYLSYYLICGIGGGLLYLLFAGLAVAGAPLPGTLARTTIGTPLIGASAGVFGVIVACARIAPDMRVMLLFPPIPLKMKWMAYGYVAIATFNLVTGGGNAGGDAAHLGGAAAGFYFIRNQHLLRGFLDFGIGPAPSGSRVNAKRAAHRSSRRAQKSDQDEVDRILAKVNAEGLQSLTGKEKKTLERASRDARDNA
ncbi:MAG: rhomboid family intramembrane serine protease [Planctomycetota bacterium]